MKKRFPELNVNQCDQDVVRTTRPGHKQRPPWPESCCPGHRHLAGALVAMPSPGFFQVAWKSLCPIGVFTWDGDTVTQLDPFPWEVQTEDVLCPEQGRVCYVSLGARPQRNVLRRNLASQLPGSSRTSPLPCKSSPTQAFHVLQPSRSTLCFGVPVAPAGAPPPIPCGCRESQTFREAPRTFSCSYTHSVVWAQLPAGDASQLTSCWDKANRGKELRTYTRESS